MKEILFKLRSIPESQKRLTVSTMLTLLRIAIAPTLVITMIGHMWGVSFLLFLVAALTDLLDGYIARQYDQQTFLGACLDPIADKFLLLSCFATLVFVQTPLFSIPLWFVCIVLIKELLVLAGTAALIMMYDAFKIKPTWLGKTTTVVQMLFIVWLFACYFFNWMPVKTYWTMLSLLLFLVLASLLQYVVIGFDVIRSKHYA